MTDPRAKDRGEGIRETLCLYVLGLLEEDERREFEALLEHDPGLRDDAAQALETASVLAFDAEAAEPPAALRDRILAKASGAGPDEAGRQVWKDWSADPGSASKIIRAGEGDWEATGFEGIRARRLYVDPDSGRLTMMVRMEAGSSYPPHRHGGLEECFVIEGDLSVGDTVLSAGDYQCMAGDSRHGVQSTEGGCLLLLTSTAHDELLP